MTPVAVPPVDPSAMMTSLAPLSPPTPAPQTTFSTSFSQLLENGVNDVNAKLMQSDQLVRAFALDDSIPVHQVTYALEQSRLSLELMMQVRNRLIDSYQQLMNMQL
jgi:flagellar hook-basal body complex protein FliE